MKRSSRADDQNPGQRAARRRGAVLLWAIMLALAPSFAQMLDLPQPIEPPEIEGPTYAAQMVATLEKEIAHFDRTARGASDTQRIVIRASLNWRIIAAELISQGEASGPSGSVSVLIGFRLAHGRGDVDSMLTAFYRECGRKERAGDEDLAGEAAALDAISRFNDAAVDLASTIRTVDAAALDAALPRIFAPLAEDLAGWAGREPVSHWPSRRDVCPNRAAKTAAGAPDDHGPDTVTFDELRQRIASSSLPDSVRRPIERALAALERGGPAPGGLERLELVLDRVLAFRESEKNDVPRDLRPVMVRLESAYATAERALLDRLDSFIGEPGALSDPACAALIAEHARCLAEAQRVRRLPAWIDAIGRINPDAAVPFENRMKQMVRWLVDATRREAAARALDAFQRELAMFNPMPFERELSEAEPAAITAAGGRHEELLDLIRETRRQWAYDWSMGKEGGEALQRLHLLRRLTRSMAVSAELIRVDGDTEIINRWAAWDMPPGLLKRSMLDLPNRLKLATAAATQENDEALAAELDRIDREAPLTRLVGRLSIALAQALEPLPDGAIGVLGQLLYSPTKEAWMIEHRRDLAELCRYAAEAHRAWFDHREDDARALQEYVNAKAREVVEVISDER